MTNITSLSLPLLLIALRENKFTPHSAGSRAEISERCSQNKPDPLSNMNKYFLLLSDPQLSQKLYCVFFVEWIYSTTMSALSNTVTLHSSIRSSLDIYLRYSVADVWRNFSSRSFASASQSLFTTIGWASPRTLEFCFSTILLIKHLIIFLMPFLSSLLFHSHKHKRETFKMPSEMKWIFPRNSISRISLT